MSIEAIRQVTETEQANKQSRAAAEQHLDETAEFIVERVVKH